MKEPFHLRPWEIERLTPYQVRRLYFRKSKSEDDDIDKLKDHVIGMYEKTRGMSHEEATQAWHRYRAAYKKDN